jgi:Caspase domain
MKRLMTGVLLALFVMVQLPLAAQQTQNIFDSKVPVTWLGLDFTNAKFIGSTVEFGISEKSNEMMASWNGLLSKEHAKFDVGRFFRKKEVNIDFALTSNKNKSLDFASKIASSETNELSKSEIEEIVASYDFTGRSGLGLMFNVESFHRDKVKSAIWITFINLNTGEVIFTERRIGKPSGIGVRNFWGNSVLNMMQEISRKDFDGWVKGNYVLNSTSVTAKVPEKPKVTREVPVKSTQAIPFESVNEAKVATAMAGSKSVVPGGKYYALLIGVSKYVDDRLNLDNPVKDAQKIKKVLTENYSFEPDNTIVLENPTRGDIFSALYKLRSKITVNDNLFIFYAGHGFWDEKIKQGYWWPRDADASDPSNWLSNSDLREQLRGISSAHTLLVSDACFSGGLFRTRDPNMKTASIDYQMLYKLPSRRAITSGTLTAVPDNSVFVEYLLKRLAQNTDQFLPAQQLFNTLRMAVINNSATVPQEGVIAETGDEGGDFIFLKTKKKP